MSEKVASLLKERFEEFTLFREALTRESDRGCALFAAAYLDKALSDLLFLSLVENNKIDNELFNGTAPLSTFSARIKMSFYLGKISAVCRRDLDLVRRIRNDFAHNPSKITFDTESIGNKCRELSFSYHVPSAKPRDHFTAACSGLFGTIQMTALTSEAPMQRPDDQPTEEAKLAHRDMIAKEFESKAVKDSGSDA